MEPTADAVGNWIAFPDWTADSRDSDDAAMLAALRQVPLNGPPEEWRAAILAAAAAPLAKPTGFRPWHRRWSVRSLAALWAVTAFFWADAARMKGPALVREGQLPPSVSPFSFPDDPELLTSLNLHLATR